MPAVHETSGGKACSLLATRGCKVIPRDKSEPCLYVGLHKSRNPVSWVTDKSETGKNAAFVLLQSTVGLALCVSLYNYMQLVIGLGVLTSHGHLVFEQDHLQTGCQRLSIQNQLTEETWLYIRYQ